VVLFFSYERDNTKKKYKDNIFIKRNIFCICLVLHSHKAQPGKFALSQTNLVLLGVGYNILVIWPVLSLNVLNSNLYFISEL